MVLRKQPPAGGADPGTAAPPDTEPPAPAPRAPLGSRPPLTQRQFVRFGVYSWAAVGIGVIVAATLVVLRELTVVIVPLVLALFPAAVLMPPANALRRRGLPSAAAAAVTLIGAVGLLTLLFSVLAPQVADELGGLADSLEQGYLRLRAYVEAGPLGLPGLPVDDLFEQLRERLSTEGSEITGRVLEAGIVLVEGVTGLIFGLLALFFYLKDGPRIAAWARDLFPRRLRADVQAIGDRAWFTIGAYIRGVLIIGMVDAVAIGTGLFVLRVPLALPLAVLVFFGALFPIVGAFAAGTVAVLVALATNGPAAALAVLILIVVVQQVEGHVLTPILLSRATQLHPLAVVSALAAGGVLAGILGAFLAVPIAASLARAVAYIRTRTATA